MNNDLKVLERKVDGRKYEILPDLEPDAEISNAEQVILDNWFMIQDSKVRGVLSRVQRRFKWGQWLSSYNFLSSF